nr:MAG TPA: hypothetical protein [Caudoviricetes sp.]
MIKIRAVFPMRLPSEKNWEGCKFSGRRIDKRHRSVV